MFFLVSTFAITAYAYTANTSKTYSNKVIINTTENKNIKINSLTFGLFGYKLEYDKSLVSVKEIVRKKSGNLTLKITGKNRGNSKLIVKNIFESYEYYIDIQQKVQKITIRSNTRQIESGQTLQISSVVLPENANNPQIVWTSSNTDVAKINADGCLIAKMAGKVTVTCTSVDGSNISDSMTFHIMPKPEAITCSDCYVKIGETFTPNISIKPKGATNTVSYTIISNSQKSVAIKNNKIVALSAGTATIEAKVTNHENISCRFQVNVFYQKPTSRQIKIYNSLKTVEGFKEKNVCQKFVKYVYEETFNITSEGAPSALAAGKKWSIKSFDEDDIYNIPAGATIYADCGEFGHVGYYDGQGMVVHQNDGKKKVTELREFIAYFHAYGWGWQNGDDLTKTE